MAQLSRLRIYIRYDALLVAQLRAMLEGIDRAYNRVHCFLNGSRRVGTEDQLRVKSVQTERSLEVILIGHAATIFGVAYLVHLVLKEKLLYWQGVKAKWDAKLAESKFLEAEIRPEEQRRIHAALSEKDPTLLKALANMQKVNRQIARSASITSVEIEFLPDEDPSEPERPKRKITLNDD